MARCDINSTDVASDVKFAGFMESNVFMVTDTLNLWVESHPDVNIIQVQMTQASGSSVSVLVTYY